MIRLPRSLTITGASLVLALSVLIGLNACASDVPTGPPPRPTVIVITAEGPYFAGFDSPADWLVGQSQSSHGRVENGRYILTITEPETIAWVHEQRAFSEGTYEVEAALQSGPEASVFGLLLLGSSDLSSFVYCVITGDGRYDVGYCEDGCQVQRSLIGDLTLAYAIQPGNATNFLQVTLEDGRLTLSVNGTLVSQVNDLDYTSGLVGLIGESSIFGGFEAAFDNLRVIEALPDSPPSPEATREGGSG